MPVQIGRNITIGRALLNRLRGAGGGAATPWYMATGVTPIAAYQPKGAATLAASYVNVANPGTYDAAPGTAPTLGADGWTFNGSTQYLTTGITPAQGWSMIVKFSGGTGAGIAAGGRASSSVDQFLLGPNIGGTTRRYGYGSTQHNVTGTLTAGIMCLAGNNAYRNGVVDGTMAAASFNGTIPAIQIGAVNTAGTTNNFFPGTIEGLAIFDTTLTAQQVADLTDAMEVFF